MPKKTAEAFAVVFFGLTGSGKSYLAERWSAARGCPCFNSDQIRKELAGVAPDSRHHVPFDEGLYSPEMTRLTYEEMLKRARTALSLGETGVVLDGSYGRQEQRRRVREVLGKGSRLFFIHCHCSESVIRSRFKLRAADTRAVSDGRAEIYEGQKKVFVVPEQVPGASLLHLDTDERVEILVEQVDRFVEDR